MSDLDIPCSQIIEMLEETSTLKCSPKKKLTEEVTSPNKRRKMIVLSPCKEKEEMPEYTQGCFLEEMMEVYQKLTFAKGGKWIEEMLQTYEVSAEMELEDENMALLLQILIQGVKELPDVFRVQEFCGPDRVVKRMSEGVWIELKLHCEKEKLLDLLHSFQPFKSLKKYMQSYVKGKRPLKVRMFESYPYTGKMSTTQRGTSTSSMTVTPTTAAVDVRSCEDSTNLYTMLKGQFSVPNLDMQTCSVSSYISARERGSQRTYSLTTEEQPFLIKLHSYRTQDIRDVPERDQWKKAYADMTYHFGVQSGVHWVLMQLFKVAAEEVLSEGGSVWERKVQ
jgi:hypothetical protein